jgi:cytochrome c551/c552
MPKVTLIAIVLLCSIASGCGTIPQTPISQTSPSAPNPVAVEILQTPIPPTRAPTATPEPTATPPPTETPLPTATSGPTATPPPNTTATPVPTETPVPPTATAAPEEEEEGEAEEEEEGEAEEENEEVLARGLQVYRSSGCLGCHALTAAGSNATVGPSHNGMRATANQRIAEAGYSGSATSAADYIRESIVNPTIYLVPGFDALPMPAFDTLSQEDLDALVQFLLAQ